MRPFVSLSCSREDDRLVGKRLVRVLITPEENVATFSPSFSLGSCSSRGHPPRYSQTQPSAQSAATSPADLLSQRMRTQVPATMLEPALLPGPGMPAASPTAGKRLAARLNVVRMSASKPSMPRPKRSAGSAPRPRPRPLRTRKLRPRVVTQQNFFRPPLMRSARLPRTPRDLAPQPGSLLRRRLPSGGSQRPGPGT